MLPRLSLQVTTRGPALQGTFLNIMNLNLQMNIPSICRAIGNIRHGLRKIVFDQVLIMYILFLMGQAKWLDNFVFK